MEEVTMFSRVCLYTFIKMSRLVVSPMMASLLEGGDGPKIKLRDLE